MRAEVTQSSKTTKPADFRDDERGAIDELPLQTGHDDARTVWIHDAAASGN